MPLEIALGFVVLVVGSYIGTTMALRGYFGTERSDRRREDSRAGEDRSSDEPDRQ